VTKVSVLCDSKVKKGNIYRFIVLVEILHPMLTRVRTLPKLLNQKLPQANFLEKNWSFQSPVNTLLRICTFRPAKGYPYWAFDTYNRPHLEGWAQIHPYANLNNRCPYLSMWLMHWCFDALVHWCFGTLVHFDALVHWCTKESQFLWKNWRKSANCVWALGNTVPD
jgi:hypothetical protein